MLGIKRLTFRNLSLIYSPSASVCTAILSGAFDITAGPLTRCWGFLQREARLPENAEN